MKNDARESGNPPQNGQKPALKRFYILDLSKDTDRATLLDAPDLDAAWDWVMDFMHVDPWEIRIMEVL